jgi:hypothetical protein
MGVFLTGVIDMRMVFAIVGRAALVCDAELMAQLDGALALGAEVDAVIGAQA